MDGAYATRRYRSAIADRGAAAVIPPRRNAQPWNPTTAGAIVKNSALRASKCLGRALWRNWSGYHRPWHPCHESRGVNPSEERGDPFVSWFAQQSLGAAPNEKRPICFENRQWVQSLVPRILSVGVGCLSFSFSNHAAERDTSMPLYAMY
ncbi:MAG: hypothetical protein ACI9U6_002407 [Loktanella salsilacus]|jgi:hypothetical protein